MPGPLLQPAPAGPVRNPPHPMQQVINSQEGTREPGAKSGIVQGAGQQVTQGRVMAEMKQDDQDSSGSELQLESQGAAFSSISQRRTPGL